MAGHYHHGNTPAAWTGVIIAFIGFCVCSYFTVVAQPWGVAAGGAVLLLACVVGLVMRSMGLGQEPAVSRSPGAAQLAAGGSADIPAQAAGEPERAAAN
ncbi:HGxxPAAW family protein [Streptomyces sp. NBRC 109706]|uniref:HGxxPAAW family protein n=1 Tax=Streptomyces sp. NBRC 109706 TaxID=1550035 RepID=UPI000780CD68|nr:HGxxPAAW family protein [Streptomyces sp. NBRC 109706]